VTERQGAPLIHATAVVDPSACIDSGVSIGPYAVIGANVCIESGCVVGTHVVIDGRTSIGAGTRIFPFASIGQAPQDKKYAGEDTALEIGRNNSIREYVTINTGTLQDEGVTRIGDENWIMAYVHIAHDCRIGHHCVLANNATLAGHVQLGDHVTLGGATLIHQFCRIGAHAFSAYGARINKDVPPFITVSEGRARPRGLNAEGLKRRGFTSDRINSLKEAYRLLYRSELSLEEAIAALEPAAADNEDVRQLRSFLRHCERSIVR